MHSLHHGPKMNGPLIKLMIFPNWTLYYRNLEGGRRKLGVIGETVAVMYVEIIYEVEQEIKWCR